MLIPVLLFKQIDWIGINYHVDVLNTVYEILFDGFVIARNKLLCYCPNKGFCGQDVLVLNNSCKSA